MNKMQAFGAPFPIEFSTNSNQKPKTFEWTTEDCPISVFIDSAIAEGMQWKKTDKKGLKVAWVCESRAIFHLIGFPKDLWEKHLQEITQSYDYVIVSDRQWCNKAPNIKFCFAGSNLPWVPPVDEIPTKTQLMSLIASKKKATFGHQLRHIIAEKYKDIIDLYGAGVKSRFGERDIPWPDKSEALLPYRFSVVIENDKYNTYFTEKLTDCFASGTIPIYWGSPDIGDYFNKEGIISLTPDLDFNTITPELYESKLEAVKDNLQRVKLMESADDILYSMLKELL